MSLPLSSRVSLRPRGRHFWILAGLVLAAVLIQQALIGQLESPWPVWPAALSVVSAWPLWLSLLPSLGLVAVVAQSWGVDLGRPAELIGVGALLYTLAGLGLALYLARRTRRRSPK
ncbi:MAG: hypothetical protein IGQ88_08175 [Gloeomargaritaceae cyanobacterium C42_A2020_066]|nr:hypothetical protein [Gloeomargaritaceae cyanobacterium C42_A2020_066]